MRRKTESRQRGVVAALEAEDLLQAEAVEVAEADAATAIAEAPIGDNANSVETDLIDLAEDCAGADADDIETDEAIEVVEALESIANALGSCAQHGGMDEHSAHVVDIAVGALYKQVGIKAPAMPALESFNGKSQRIGATHLAMESLKENIGKIWEAIVAAIQKAISWAMEFYKSVRHVAEGLANRAKSLTEKVNATSGEAAERAFENERLVATLNIKGSVPVNLSSDLNKLDVIVKAVFASHSTYIGEAGRGILDALKNGTRAGMAENFTLPEVKEPWVKEVINPEAAGFNSPKEGLTVFRSDELFGGKAVIVCSPKGALKGREAVEAVGGLSSTLGAFNPKANPVTKKELPILSKQDMVAVCAAVSEYAKELIGYREKQAELDELKKELLEVAKAAARHAETAEVAEAEDADAVRRIATSMPRLIDQPSAPLSKYTVTVSKGLLDYVEESLKQYA